MKLGLFSPLLFTVILACGTAAADPMDDLDALLAAYATESGVRYHAWANTPEALQKLDRVLGDMQAMDPEGLEPPDALAFWINLYNAATLNLVLTNYPIRSIKDTAGLFKSPWKKKLVTISGKELTLDEIENGIIRPRFGDARVHFALNCASVGCPPLAAEAYRGADLDPQLDAACRKTLNDSRWVRVEEDRLVLTPIFDWYREDFEKDAGSVIAFIARYREDGKLLMEKDPEIEYAEYDWSLNQAAD